MESPENEPKFKQPNIYRIKSGYIKKFKREILKIRGYEEKHPKVEPDSRDKGYKTEFFILLDKDEDDNLKLMNYFLDDKSQVHRTKNPKLIFLFQKILHTDDSDSLESHNYALFVNALSGKLREFLDTEFPFVVGKRFINPSTIKEMSLRYLSGNVIKSNKQFHIDKKNSRNFVHHHDAFAVVKSFSGLANIPLNCSEEASSIRRDSLDRSLKVTHSSVCVRATLNPATFFQVLDSLTSAFTEIGANPYDYRFLENVRLVKDTSRQSLLNEEFKTALTSTRNVNTHDFHICPEYTTEWIQCSNFKLMQRKRILGEWTSAPTFDDVFDKLPKSGDFDEYNIGYIGASCKMKSLSLLECIQGSFFLEETCYYHLGKKWYFIDQSYLNGISSVYNSLLNKICCTCNQDKSWCLPFPWAITTEVGISNGSNKEKLLKHILSHQLNCSDYEHYPQRLDRCLNVTKAEKEYCHLYYHLDKFVRGVRVEGGRREQKEYPKYFVGYGESVDNIKLFDLLRLDEDDVYMYFIQRDFSKKD